MVEVYHPIVCRETTALWHSLAHTGTVYHPIVCRETTAGTKSSGVSVEYITLLSVGKPRLIVLPIHIPE